MLENFTKTFMDKEYAAHRQDILWKREESYLPATMERVARIQRGRQMEKEILKDMLRERERLANQVRKMDADIRLLEIHTINPLLRGEEPIALQDRHSSQSSTTERVVMNRKCMSEDCKGWLNSQWHCGLCDNYTCNGCFAIKGKVRDADHTCDPGAKASADLIKKDTKPCPNCGTGIFRSEGCPVMFCTNCHKGFNWNTMKIVETNIHNPHYYEWMAANGGGRPRAVGDIPCGGVPDERFIWNLAKSPEKTLVSNMHRILTHITHIEIPNNNPENMQLDIVAVRTEYLLGEMSASHAKSILYNNEKRVNNRRVIYDILHTCVTVGSDLLRNIIAEIEEVMKLTNVAREFKIYNNAVKNDNDGLIREWVSFKRACESLRLFINKSMIDAACVYKLTSFPIITKDWLDIIHPRRTIETIEMYASECGYMGDELQAIVSKLATADSKAKAKAKARAADEAVGGGAGGGK
jgi:hypothetical protein